MLTYKEILKSYKKKKKENMADVVATGLTYADEVCVGTGLLIEDTPLREIAGGALGVLPFAIIAFTEQKKVFKGEKTQKRGLKDAGSRMAKTGVAMGIGAAAVPVLGPLAALPVSLGVRSAMNHYRSKFFLQKRVKERTERLRELRGLMDQSPSFKNTAKQVEQMDVVALLPEPR